jgi:ribosomal protein S18 acetylase RimI-like enzyme
MGFDQFSEAMLGFDVIPVAGGAVLVKGNEVHVAVVQESKGRWLSRRLIKEVLGKIIEQYGVAVTAVMSDNEQGQRFVERLGFVKIRSEEKKAHYELRKLRF